MSTYRYSLVALLVAALALPATATADDYLRCESHDGRRVYCAVHGADSDDIEFHRQLSKKACIEDVTWGLERRGVWVDDGCRAEFKLHDRRYGHDRDDDRWDDHERERLQLERERAELERQRLELERQRQQQQATQNERCPAGFQPSENKCSPEERRRGCKDIRLPNGLGCVKR